MIIAILFIICFIAIFIFNARCAKNARIIFENESNQTQYNPATGLPMIGALDSMGNSMGSSASDRNDYWNSDYHRLSTFNSSSYDPFSNRY
ncbi:hypothetical protein BN59_03737 [Legionella massiliensis]|uniref:Uncharacterized protein n=1 Tax=Legionella massiliensis TaxID=1034943 RepID=A0A078L5U2_9GAMM|nr:hypothetical protein [Legionella massiliensis]CDZ79419.1 hypothetical protein BN59_03737 [Legionella massiliensis]CEE15157.1 hypothetical protein BN1094_03737 [Legionella massiliensis]